MQIISFRLLFASFAAFSQVLLSGLVLTLAVERVVIRAHEILELFLGAGCILWGKRRLS